MFPYKHPLQFEPLYPQVNWPDVSDQGSFIQQTSLRTYFLVNVMNPIFMHTKYMYCVTTVSIRFQSDDYIIGVCINYAWPEIYERLDNIWSTLHLKITLPGLSLIKLKLNWHWF